MNNENVYAVEMRGIVKKFPGVIANDNINFYVKKGEIHALLGENGAGKTTLMNILYGLYKPDQGEIYVYGERADIKSPRDAIRYGIGMVHQHFTLVPPFTVTENVILGYEGNSFILNLKAAKNKIKKLIEQYKLGLDPDTKIWQLSVGERQKVEILKVLFRAAKILILDEPTAVLTPPEIKGLFKFLKKMKNEGKSIIFISHKLKEVMEISDRITVLRKGKVVGTKITRETNEVELAKMMVGREVVFTIKKETPTKIGEKVLKVVNLWVRGDRGLYAVKGVSLDVKSGEILGIAGVSGNGQREFAESIMGIRKVEKGKIFINNIDVTNRSPKDIILLNVAYLPEDREESGYFHDASIRDNLCSKVRYSFLSKFVFLDYDRMNIYADRLIKEFDILTPSRENLAKNLSGGNKQRLVLARELAINPKLLIANQPTRGLDVGATEFMRRKILEQRDAGVAILLISEDLDEILMLSDRVAVFYEGRIMGIVRPEDVSIEDIGLMMAGAKEMGVIAK